MKSKSLILILLSFSFIGLKAQKNQYLRYVIHDTSYYGEMQRIFLSHEGISYGSPFNLVSSLGERRIELNEGEGKQGNLLAANLDLRYPIAMGRPSSNSFYRRSRLTFDYRVNFRMTLDDSKPIVPYSNDVGLGYDFIFHDSKFKWWFEDDSVGNLSPLEKNSKYQFYTLSVQAHHYSNGQPLGFYLVNADSSDQRNNYQNGDFSTNFIRLKLIWTLADNSKHSLMNVSLGARFDGGFGGALKYSDEQIQSYGQTRLEAGFDYFTEPRERLFFWKTQTLLQYRYRATLEYISDDLSLFRPNLVGSNSAYRLSGHGFFEIRPLNHRSVGYMLHLFAGRDYLNIRYDDIVFVAQFGVSLCLDKFNPFGWRNAKTGGME
tara:strand:+ start:24635 stop:25762 length:1128 start_codon:yes stop_codon:yes gene_type:complete